MKAVLYLYIFLNTFYAVAQTTTPALKVYLEDGYNGKNIKDAKVTLEGFEIPEIIGKYNKKGKYYYFETIPAGYNTVMAYHKKYNEKGFQDVNGLPDKISFSLHDEKNVSYSFLKVDSISNESHKWKIRKDYFVEDPYKIVIRPKTAMGYNEFKDFILRKIIDLGLNIEYVNPYYEEMKPDTPDLNNGKAYPDIKNPNIKYGHIDFILPITDGASSLLRDIYTKNICIIFRKKDGSKFKRFNAPTIKILKKNCLTVYGIALSKTSGNEQLFTNGKNPFKIRDRQNRIYNTNNSIDSSKVFFYQKDLRNFKKPFRLFKKTNTSNDLYEDTNITYPDFYIISNDNYKIPKDYINEMEHEFNKLQIIPEQEQSIGLGILDQYDYFYKIRTSK